MPAADIPVEEVVADVSGGPFEPLREDRPFLDVEVVREELVDIRRGLPVELLGDFPPEVLGVVDGLLVHVLVLGHGGDEGGRGECLVWQVDRLFRRHVGDWLVVGRCTVAETQARCWSISYDRKRDQMRTSSGSKHKWKTVGVAAQTHLTLTDTEHRMSSTNVPAELFTSCILQLKSYEKRLLGLLRSTSILKVMYCITISTMLIICHC